MYPLGDPETVDVLLYQMFLKDLCMYVRNGLKLSDQKTNRVVLPLV